MQSAHLLGFSLALALVSSQADVDINAVTASQIRKNLNRTASPCTDFYRFACGGFSNNTPASRYVDNFEWVEDQFATALVEFMESDVGVHDTQAPRLIYQMRSYYKACTRDKEQWSPADPPEAAIHRRLSWGYVSPFGSVIDERADVATNDSTRRVVQLTMPPPSDRYRMLRALQIIQSPDYVYDSKENVTQLIKNLQELQDKHRRYEPVVYTWSYKELLQQIPAILWAPKLSSLFEVMEHPQIFNNLIFEVSDVEYYRDLVLLLRPESLKDFEEYARVRHMVLLQESAPRNRNPKSCIHHMRALLPLGINYLYDRFVYQNREQDTRRLQEIFTSLKATFKKYLEGNRLELSSRMLAYLERKLAGMQLKVGNLPEEKSPEFYNSHYESAIFMETSFLGNLLEALSLRTRLQHAGLLEPGPRLVTETSFLGNLLEALSLRTRLQPGSRLNLRRYYVNDNVVKARTSPFYENERNTITVPMEFLQFPLFDHRQHPIFQESLVGAVLGHEMSHAFEQEGVLFNACGNESPMGLQIRESRSFQEAIKCAEGQQAISLKERLADLNGLQLAYDAFFGFNHDSRKLEYRPYAFEAEFPAPQLFHLSYAQFFCGSLPPVIAHDRDDERVNVSVGNLRQFAYDFQCHQSSSSSPSAEQAPLPPVCEMWRPRE